MPTDASMRDPVERTWVAELTAEEVAQVAGGTTDPCQVITNQFSTFKALPPGIAEALNVLGC
jgi:hypothetical protein